VLSILPVLVAVPALAQQTGYLKAKVNPGRAGVFIDGKYLGPAANFRKARKYALPPGEYELKLSEPRYEDLVTKVKVEAGKTVEIQETMKPRELAKPPFGRLRIVDFPKFSAVYINTRYFGHADEFSNFAQGVLLNPGQYDVRVEPAGGGAPVERKIAIEADKVTKFTAQ
jgi:hypothetical protein